MQTRPCFFKENIWQIALTAGVGFKSRFCNLCQFLKPSSLLYLVCKHSIKIIFIICEKIFSEIHIQDTKEEHVFVYQSESYTMSKDILLFFSCQEISDSSRPHGSQHARAPLSSTISQSLPKPKHTVLMTLSNHLIHPLFLLIFPNIRVFYNESFLLI